MSTVLQWLKLLRVPFVPLYLKRGSRKLKKWTKKNKKEQDPNLYSFNERWTVVYKKTRGALKRLGVEVNVIGEENIPNSASWIVANHSSNLDGMIIIAAIGGKIPLASVAKKELLENKTVAGYFIGTESFMLDRADIKQNLKLLQGAANWAKTFNRGVVIFPEGKRVTNTEMEEFKSASFVFPQKYAIPIVPLSITGTLQARKVWKPGKKIVNVTVHKPIKSIEHIKIPREILSRRIWTMLNDDLLKYEKSLTPTEAQYLQALKDQPQNTVEKKS